MAEGDDEFFASAAAEAQADVLAEAPAAAEAEPVKAGGHDADVEADARRLGWKPEAEWRGDKSGWIDAATFMERTRTLPGHVKKLEADFTDRIARLERAHEAALKRQAEAHKAELARVQTSMDRAIEAGDVEEARRLRIEEARIRDAQVAPQVAPQADPNKPPPEVTGWVSRNSWFTTDAVMRAAAQALAGKAAEAGMTVAEQLAYVDREMPAQFPHRFARKPATPTVDGGGLGGAARRGKGVADLPSEARAAGERFVRDKIYKDLAEYAKDYFAGETA